MLDFSSVCWIKDKEKNTYINKINVVLNWSLKYNFKEVSLIFVANRWLDLIILCKIAVNFQIV